MEIVNYINYREYKAALDHEMEKTAEGFVKIGYLLRMAEDTNILADSGYKDVNDFAKKEYNLDASQVSRFININRKFAEGGYSDKLMDQYRGFGSAKLSLMLLLPGEVNEIITPNYSKSDIMAIKSEVEAERETTDLEILAEGEATGQQEMDLVHKVLHQLGHDEPELYRRMHVTAQRRQDSKSFLDILAPTGEGVKTVRIQGTGRVMMAFKGVESYVSLVNIRSNERESVKWQQLIDAIKDLMHFDVSSKESWEKLYGETWPIVERTEIAPVQKPEKVTKAKVEPKEEPKKEPKKEKAEKPKPEKQILTQEEEEPHQMNVEEYPEYLPDGYIKSHDGSEIKENPEIKHWNEIEDLIDKMRTEMGTELKNRDVEYMLQAAELMVLTLKEIKAVRTEHESA